MNLGEIRSLFVERSGREDLVDAEDADNGANFFIQSGQRTLDRLLEMNQSWARSFKTLAAGDYYAIFKGCRAVKEVWLSFADGTRIRMEKVSRTEMRTLYYENSPAEVTQGTTLQYCLISLRTYPDEEKVVIDNLYDDKLTDAATSDYEYTGIIFQPPPNEPAELEVFGLFRSPSLTEDADESYWSVQHPEVLLMAALYHLEVSYRNTEGAKDWMNAILLETTGIEKDWIESEIADIDQMEG